MQAQNQLELHVPGEEDVAQAVAPTRQQHPIARHGRTSDGSAVDMAVKSKSRKVVLLAGSKPGKVLTWCTACSGGCVAIGPLHVAIALLHVGIGSLHAEAAHHH